MSWITDVDGGVVLNLRVVPRASKDEVKGALGDALKVKLRAPPVEGRANAALIAFLSDRLDVPPGRVAILSGATARLKRVRVQGARMEEVRAKLGL